MILKLRYPKNETNANARFKLVHGLTKDAILCSIIESESIDYAKGALLEFNHWDLLVVEDEENEPDDKVSLSAVKWGFQLAMIMGIVTGFIFGCVSAYYFIQSLKP